MRKKISKRLHNSFAIIWGILGVTILALLSNTDHQLLEYQKNFIQQLVGVVSVAVAILAVVVTDVVVVVDVMLV